MFLFVYEVLSIGIIEKQVSDIQSHGKRGTDKNASSEGHPYCDYEG